MILDEGTLIDISLNSTSYDSNSTTDLYNIEKKKKKKMVQQMVYMFYCYYYMRININWIIPT